MRIYTPSAKQKRRWAKWVASRPKKVRRVAERFPPWELYRLKSSGQHGVVRSFGADGSVSFAISGEHNLVLFERIVFGVDPDDLVPSDGPAPEEPTGSLLKDDEVNAHIDALRVLVRPDLWVMGEDGKAIRKS